MLGDMNVAKDVDLSGGVLVGHDGSRFANKALSWALEYADAFGHHVTVVRVWVITTAPRPKTWESGYVPPLADFAAATLEALEADIAPVRAKFADAALSCQAVHGSAAKLLLEASERADILVVGARGRGGFLGLSLGSVSEKLTRFAKSTVVVVRADDSDPTPAADIEYDGNVDFDRSA